jgi:tartrate-resistant acid phosphatase type 5
MNARRTLSLPTALGLLVLLILLAGCSAPPAMPVPATATAIISPTLPEPSATVLPASAIPPASPSLTFTPSPTQTPPMRFAVIGDFGDGGQGEADVAALVHGWNPDIIITVGDDNYPLGAAGSIDAHIGKFYHDFIFPYLGAYGPGAKENLFFPTLGNHDWYSDGAKPYFDYFSLQGNERYYDFVRGPVHFFALDSNENEPDGFRSNSIQAAWLKQELAASTSSWNIVYFHHAPFSSGIHGPSAWMQWPFAAWGAQVVLSGHDHTYERLLVDGIPYFVNGVGGAGIYDFVRILPESQFRYNADHGAMLVTASGSHLLFEFYNRTGKLIDQYEMQKP